MTLHRLAILSVCAAALAGCSVEHLHITSNPPGCSVTVQERPGITIITPGTLELPAEGQFTIVCTAPDGRSESEVLRWTPVPFLERLGITAVLTPVSAVLGVGSLVGGFYIGSGELMVIGAVLIVATPLIPIMYILDTGYFDHGRPRTLGEGPGQRGISLRSSIHFEFTGQ
ncbi:MAG: hypothetical protein ACYTFG_07685 [Planctomycetota bacterium]|jgi:hypothetical protein